MAGGMLTNKGKYGLKAMVHLAGADRAAPVPVGVIAAENDIPRKFLDAILADLRHAGLLHSRKGPAGGYALARPASEITLGDIVRALDGPLAPIGCASRTAYRACADCGDVAACPVRLAMLEVRDAMSAVLDRRTLAELRGRTLAERRSLAGAADAITG
jgi:Rrf2 family protein